jgi:hypothetical protein
LRDDAREHERPDATGNRHGGDCIAEGRPLLLSLTFGLGVGVILPLEVGDLFRDELSDFFGRHFATSGTGAPLMVYG